MNAPLPIGQTLLAAGLIGEDQLRIALHKTQAAASGAHVGDQLAVWCVIGQAACWQGQSFAGLHARAMQGEDALRDFEVHGCGRFKVQALQLWCQNGVPSTGVLGCAWSWA